jgi:hypothetical protein
MQSEELSKGLKRWCELLDVFFKSLWIRIKRGRSWIKDERSKRKD